MGNNNKRAKQTKRGKKIFLIKQISYFLFVR